MLYEATHYTYTSTDGPGVGESRTFGSVLAATKWAHTVLPATHTVSDENYWTDVRRCPSVTIVSVDTRCGDRLRGKKRRAVALHNGHIGEGWKLAVCVEVTPEIQVAPSVGQKGYW